MNKMIIILTLFSLFLLTACSPGEKYCQTDNDCVAATCCHPTEAVNKNYAPNCEDAFCTMECQEGTLDCDGGEIKCVNNTCKAIIK